MLQDAGWTEGKDWINEYEIHGMPNKSEVGFADYVLLGDNGRILAVIEAKRTCVDVSKGRQQAKLYADLIEKKQKRRPVVFLTNGFETRIIDNQYPERKVSVIYSKRDLEKLFNLQTMRSSLKYITVDKNISNENTENEIRECLMKAVEDATDAFVAMREVEGETLKKNIIEKVAFVNDALQKIEERAPFVSKDYRARLEAKLADLDEIQVDESRLLTEVMLFADKACIDEEITRLHSHISQMYSIVEESVPVGRKLDFLVQEMNRETNTIGSKSNDIQITNHVVDIKSEIEKIREQIQNIE